MTNEMIEYLDRINGTDRKAKTKICQSQSDIYGLRQYQKLDFKKPGQSEYRIRFMFEEDYYRLHISGDLGELIATNYNNMTFNMFPVFVEEPYYFEEKIDCHSRDLYFYDEDTAKTQILKYFDGEQELIETIRIFTEYGAYTDSDEETLEDFFDDVFEEFDHDRGISNQGMSVLAKLTDDEYSLWSEHFGRERTGIIELYLMAFQLAYEQIKERKQ